MKYFTPSIFRNPMNWILFFVFLMINCMTPLTGDDLWRGSISALYNHSIIENLVHDYYHWTGRMSAQILVYIFLNEPYNWLSIPILNVLNAFIVVLFYQFTFDISSKKNTSSANYLFFILFVTLVFVFNGFIKNVISKTLCIQYLWGIVLILWFVKKEYFNTEPKKNKIIFSFLLGVFIGLYNEIFFATILISYFFLLLYHHYIDSIIFGIKSKQVLFFNIGNLIAGLILVIAPGNYVRLHLEEGQNSEGWMMKLSQLIGSIFSSSSQNAHILVGMMLAAILLLFFFQKRKKTLKLFSLLFYFLALWLIFLPIASGGFVSRKLLLASTIVIIILFKQGAFLEGQYFDKKWIKTLCLSLITIIFGIYLYGAYHFYCYDVALMRQVKQYQKEGVKVAEFKDYKTSKILSQLLYRYELAADFNKSDNVHFAMYYHFDKVFIIKDE